MYEAGSQHEQQQSLTSRHHTVMKQFSSVTANIYLCTIYRCDIYR